MNPIAIIRRHPVASLALAWLAFISVAALAFNLAPQLPIDARSGRHVAGAQLAFPGWGAVIEPVAALGHMLAGAPDMRVAIVSTLVWITAMALAVALLRRLPARRAARLVVGSMLVYLLYLCFVLLVPLPDWRFQSDDPQLIVADLHSHSLYSHDGLVTPAYSLSMHKARGYDIVGFTEHGNPVGAAVAASFGGHGRPATIPGIEVQTPSGAFLLAMGLKPGKPVLTVLHDHADTLRFIHQVHDIHHGVVIALNFRLTPQRVEMLADDGIDGFEIANAGHPSLSPALRRTLLAMQRTRGLVLIASSDWHGWGGFFHTWTLIRPRPSEIGATKRETVLNVLRRHDAEAVIPATADAMGAPSTARAVFAPFAEALRYARELSPWRLAAWWGWVIVLMIAARRLTQRGLDAGRAMLAAWLAVCAAGLMVEGASMLVAAMGAANGFAMRIGASGIGVGIMAAWAAAWNSRRVVALSSSGGRGAPESAREWT